MITFYNRCTLNWLIYYSQETPRCPSSITGSLCAVRRHCLWVCSSVLSFSRFDILLYSYCLKPCLLVWSLGFWDLNRHSVWNIFNAYRNTEEQWDGSGRIYSIRAFLQNMFIHSQNHIIYDDTFSCAFGHSHPIFLQLNSLVGHWTLTKTGSSHYLFRQKLCSLQNPMEWRQMH